MGITTRDFIVMVNAKDAGDINSLGSIKMSRALKEYEALNTGAIVQAIGNMKTSPISIGLLYNPADAAGAKELETALNDATSIPFSIEMNNAVTPSTGNGTTWSWTAAVISDLELNPEQDGMWLATFTVAVNGAPTVTAAA